MTDELQDAARYRWLRDNGFVNEKNPSRAIIGDKAKAKVAFRYWCEPDVLDKLIDESLIKTASSSAKSDF